MTGTMRFRFGMMIGFAGGYYLGARAGRERYEQINKALAKVRGSDTVERATDTAKAAVDVGVERAREVVEDKLDRNGAGGGSEPAWPPKSGT